MNKQQEQPQIESLPSSFNSDSFSQEISLIEEFHSDQPSPLLPLLKGEQLLSEQAHPIILIRDQKQGAVNFRLHATNYRLILRQQGKDEGRKAISIPYGYMQQIDLIDKQIRVFLKTGVGIRFRTTDVKQVYQLVLAGTTNLPFCEGARLRDQEGQHYDCLAEIERMRINWDYFILVQNNKGKICLTYPKYFVVPKSLDPNLLQQCARNRIASKIPILTYFSHGNAVAIWRAGRIKLGFQQNKYNKAYLNEIAKDIFTIDVRDEQISKQSSKDILSVRFESLPMVQTYFHRIVSSYSKNQSVLRHLPKWYEQVQALLNCAYKTVQIIKNKRHILIQQGSGSDRSAQISALAQIIVDPYYRTFQGFGLLVQKEFVTFGHQFHRRLGFQRQKIGQMSPIFLQFLECVYQLISTHPSSFQFSGYYIARVGYEIFTTKYNDFLYNSYHQKYSNKSASKTESIWVNLPMRKEYFNIQWKQTVAMKELGEVRRAPFIKQFLIWRQYLDLVGEMRGEEPEEGLNLIQKSICKKIRRMSSQC